MHRGTVLKPAWLPEKAKQDQRPSGDHPRSLASPVTLQQSPVRVPDPSPSQHQVSEASSCHLGEEREKGEETRSWSRPEDRRG